MTRAVTFPIASILVELLVPAACLAQTDPWERVKLVETGRKVSISLSTGKSVNGRLQTWTPEGVTLLRGNKTEQIAKSQVTKVAMVSGMSRGRRAAWAGAIGGGIGAGLYGGVCASGRCEDAPGAIVAGGALLIGGVAAAIAALIPHHKEVIYTAKTP